MEKWRHGTDETTNEFSLLNILVILSLKKILLIKIKQDYNDRLERQKYSLDYGEDHRRAKRYASVQIRLQRLTGKMMF